jgi:hypothetical protein
VIASLKPISIAPKAKNWLKNSRQARVLHVFQTALNLINEHDQVFSLVTPTIGNGPFSMVVKKANFTNFADSSTTIQIIEHNLWIGDVPCPCNQITVWWPRPDWDSLRSQKKYIATQIKSIEALIHEHGSADSFSQIFTRTGCKPGYLQNKIAGAARDAIENLSKGLNTQDLLLVQDAVKQLAGLGLGLTPSGDDCLMGVIYGLWSAYPQAFAVQCAKLIYRTAKGKTNHLSTAWLGAAAEGETGEIWHDLFSSFLAQKNALTKKSITRILATGHTSGSDALGGFTLAIKNAK